MKHTARFKRLYEVALNMGMSNADATYYALRVIEYEKQCATGVANG